MSRKKKKSTSLIRLPRKRPHLKPASLRHHLQGLLTVIAARGRIQKTIENGELNATVFTTMLM